MRDKLEIAPWGPTRLEVYVACVALRQGVPRQEVKRLKRERLINSDGALTPEGKAQIGRLRQLRKEGKVAEKPADTPVTVPPRPQRNYPGLGSRRARRFNKKAERINRKRGERLIARLKAQGSLIQTKPSEHHVFESAYESTSA